jgi:hypothetical protein
MGRTFGRRGTFDAPGLSSAVIPVEVHAPKCRRFPDGSRCAGMGR